MAARGTVFLDEISNSGPEVQGKLLRFLEQREFLPLGANAVRKVDVRLIFATNQNLEEMVATGTFRRTSIIAYRCTRSSPRRCASGGRTFCRLPITF